MQPVSCKPANPVEREFYETSRWVNFWKKPIHKIKFTKCKNFSRYFTKRWFHHRRSPSNFKKFRKLTGIIFGGVSFQHSCPCFHTWLPCNLLCNLILQQQWRCYEKKLIAKVWKTLWKKSLISLFIVELQAYTVQLQLYYKQTLSQNIFRITPKN